MEDLEKRVTQLEGESKLQDLKIKTQDEKTVYLLQGLEKTITAGFAQLRSDMTALTDTFNRRFTETDNRFNGFETEFHERVEKCDKKHEAADKRLTKMEGNWKIIAAVVGIVVFLMQQVLNYFSNGGKL